MRARGCYEVRCSYECRSERAGAITKNVLLDLPGRCLGEVTEDDCFRYLEPGHFIAAKVDDLVLRGRLLAVFQGNEGARRFAPLLVGTSDDGNFQHRRMTVQHVLDLDGRNVLAA